MVIVEDVSRFARFARDLVAEELGLLLLIKRGNSPEGFVAVDISNK